MQASNTRMRRAAERENDDINARIGGSDANPKFPKNKRRSTQINSCLLILILSPIMIVAALVFVVQQYQAWSLSVSEGGVSATDNLKRLRSPQAQDQKVVIDRDEDLEPPVEINELQQETMEKRKDRNGHSDKKYLILTTEYGNIQITLRPDLSSGSVDYIYKLSESFNGGRCTHCNFYRSEKPGILQGIMENKDTVPINTVRGSCPEGAEDVHNDCPEWDKHCGCHGPVMTRGSVAWAAGEAGGPDFFIDGYPGQADWWGTQHTNFGVIQDEASFAVLDTIWDLPVEKTPEMDFIKEPVHFDLLLK